MEPRGARAEGIAISRESGHSAIARPRYRADIDGLRAVAVFLVVLFHAGFQATPGGYVGVDVFYVISGYLITSLLLRELQEQGKVQLLDFWARRMRRILPAGVLVLFASMIGAVIFLPIGVQGQAAREMPAAALYFINWRLAERAVDYFAGNAQSSLFLQYWSLAIEEQFYAAWPLIVSLAWFAGLRFFSRFTSAQVLLWTAIAITLTSFVTCLYLTSYNQPYAYFGTFSRAWQLGVGAIISLMPLLSIGVLARRALALGGVFSIVLAAILFTHETPYPGFAALWPTIGTAAVILAGRGEEAGGLVESALKIPAVVHIGKWSYSWYLWHWPVLFIGTAYSVESGWLVFLVLLSLLFAILTYYLVEQPTRYWRGITRAPGISVSLGLFLSVGAAGFAVIAQASFAKPMIYLSTGESLEADAVRDDKADRCLLSYNETDLRPCIYGDVAGPRRALLFGDSHAASWLPALEIAAKENGWKLLVRTKASCASMNVTLLSKRLNRPYSECSNWRDEVLSEVKEFQPELIFLSNISTPSVIDGNGKHLKGEDLSRTLLEGEKSLVAQLTASTNAKVVLIRDVPGSAQNIVDCLLENPLNEDACVWAKKPKAYPRGTYGDDNRVVLMDLTNDICPSETCSAVLGEHIVMRDRHHLSASFARTLASKFEPLFRANDPE